MNRPRQLTVSYEFTVYRNLTNTVLSIDYYNVGRYPFTYSITNCLEHFCDTVGWEFVCCRHSYEGLNNTNGSITMKYPYGGDSCRTTFYKAQTLFTRGGR